MPTTSFSQREIQALAQEIGAILLPQIQEMVMGKAQWTVRSLSTLAGEWLSVKETSRILNVSEKHVRKLIDNGSLPHLRVGSSIKIERGELEQLVRERRI